MQTKAHAISKLELRLNEFNAAIAEYQNYSHLARGPARIVYQDNLYMLRQQSALTRDRIEQINTSDETAKDDFVLEVDRLHDVYINSFNTFKYKK